MNKKSAEYLRKQGYLVEENVYQGNPNQGTGSKIKKEEKLLTPSEQLTKLEELVFNSGCELLQKYQTWKDNYLTKLAEERKMSDIELIKELRKRVNQKAIKLTIYPSQEHLFITAQDATQEVSFPLPIEIKEGEKNDNQKSQGINFKQAQEYKEKWGYEPKYFNPKHPDPIKCLDCQKHLIYNGNIDYFWVGELGKDKEHLCSDCYWKRLNVADPLIINDYNTYHNWDKKPIPKTLKAWNKRKEVKHE